MEGDLDIRSWLLSQTTRDMPAYSIYFGEMKETLRAELMVVIQDHVLFKSGRLQAGLLGTVVRKAERENVESLLTASEEFWDKLNPSVRTLIEDTLKPLHRGWRAYDPWVEDLLFLQDLGLRKEGPRRTKVQAPAPLDLTVITQGWLREPFRQWVLLTRDRRRICIQVYGLLLLVSKTLDEQDQSLRHDTARLNAGVMSVIVNAIHARWPINPTLGHQLAWWWKITDFARRHELWDDIPRSFARDPGAHRNRGQETEKTRPLLPREAVEHIRNNLDVVSGPSAETARAMLALYIDTGRRPGEIAALTENCLVEHANGDVDIIYDDTKTGHPRRSLVINQNTADVIRAWRASPTRSGVRSKWLFPVVGAMNSTVDRHITSQHAATALRAMLEAMPAPAWAPSGHWLPRMGGRFGLILYDFRHAYAQRHADEGVEPDVLMELMGHKTFRTTLVYYEVSGARKRAAVHKVRPLVMDRTGTLTNTGKQRARLSTVAVPYGGCSEPSNVAAAGNACPIRFQCSGCTFYRPDPSYLPDIEHQLIKLRTELAAARHMGAADFVIRGYEDEIRSFEVVTEAMRTALARLPDQERLEVEEASRTLRAARLVNAARPLLPIRPVTHGDD
ncbi:MAG: tyrosine-type recombinase/integrase [Salinibacterium sp.]|nr:tyrosine-type recombinase/integrase [Salinibacterium sp.]